MIIKLPDKFKLAPNQLKGTCWIPFTHVFHHYAIPIPDTLEESIALAPLMNETYQRDNCKVYGIIKQLVIKGPGPKVTFCLMALHLMGMPLG